MSCFKPWCFALLCAVMLVPACARKTEPPASAGESPSAAPSDGSAAAAPTTPATDAPAEVAPSDVPTVAAATNDGIFKYTITTDSGIGTENIEILVAMNSVEGQYPVKYDLDCEGDGEFEYKGLTNDNKCIYKRNSGKHQIWLRGEIPGMFLCARRDSCMDDCPENAKCEKCIIPGVPDVFDDSKYAVVSIDSWGDVSWKSMHLFAARCYALDKLPEGSPDLRQVKDMSGMFSAAKKFNQPIEHWDVSNITNMSVMFSRAESFNQPLENWNVSNVTDMNHMFSIARSFNQPLEKWDVSNVTNMSGMFYGYISFCETCRSAFNQPLEKWNVSNVTNMHGMFWDAISFNQPLEKWNVSNVTDMGAMFVGAKSFSHYPKSWVVPARDVDYMFTGTKVEAEAKKSPLKTK